MLNLLYTSKNCIKCNALKMVLDNKSISYITVDISDKPNSFISGVKNEFDVDIRSVPFIISDDNGKRNLYTNERDFINSIQH